MNPTFEIQYTKLGEDLFHENGVAINSAGTVASKKGVVIDNLSYCWIDSNYRELKSCTDDLHQVCGSIVQEIGVTDEFLKETKPLAKMRSAITIFAIASTTGTTLVKYKGRVSPFLCFLTNC